MPRDRAERSAAVTTLRLPSGPTIANGASGGGEPRLRRQQSVGRRQEYGDAPWHRTPPPRNRRSRPLGIGSIPTASAPGLDLTSAVTRCGYFRPRETVTAEFAFPL